MDGQIPEQRQMSPRMIDGARGIDDGALRLAKVVEAAVIPHLLLRCRPERRQRVATQYHVETLARLLLSHDHGAADRQLTDLQQAGMSTDTALHDLMAPAARRLGSLWFHDSANFVDVAVATTRLTGLVRRLCQTPVPIESRAGFAPRALFIAPGAERHGLGMMIAAHDFRRAGWLVSRVTSETGENLGESVANTACDLVGLSLSADRHVDTVAALISEIRFRALRASPIIMVGGAVAPSMVERLHEIGADHVVNDSREAVRLANEHLSRRGVAGTMGARI